MKFVQPAISGQEVQGMVMPFLHALPDGRLLLVGLIQGIVMPAVHFYDPATSTYSAPIMPPPTMDVPGVIDRVATTVFGNYLYICIYAATTDNRRPVALSLLRFVSNAQPVRLSF
jgi:hypothetical protein